MTQYYGGPPPHPQPLSAPMAPRRKNWIGTTALVVAVGGLAICWSVLGGVLLGAVGIVMGLVGRGRVARAEADNRTVATSGIALGVLAVVVSLALIPAWVRFAREVEMPAYLDCAAKTSDQEGARRCMDDLQERIDELFGATTSPTPGSA
ncbi:DUF4190 domain-containing protein [Mycolicibacterium arenosum]|uniref:DUF4190 domain-containing protein n=1 Tax=Mycolicibacterium arenosum TaxID=2952157 RepID=A0ABT1M0D9_9MYCO|nr:DUF4190 domain-containing protein [Mycolicibacterium sp. CAU 1645]MCP9272621.1 DUF4190 domain-containing protein [Mycolicibacterium sp. CAU 1645]